MAKIQIKRGLQAAVTNLSLSEGEMAVALDTGNVYVGTTTGKVHINPSGGTSEEALKLKNARNFSISGDGSSAIVSFDGTDNVNLSLVLNAMAGLTAGTYTKLTVDEKGRVTAGATITVEDLPDISYTDIKNRVTKVSELTNDSNFQTATQVEAIVAGIVDAAPDTLNTLNELAAALGDDPNFASTMTTELAGKETLIKNATAKTTIVDNDTVPISDSADSSTTKKISFANIKATLKTYFDTLYNKYTHPTYTARANGLYKVTVDGTGHVSGVTAISKADITGLGIPAQDTVYSLPTASSTVLGGVKVGSGLTISSGVVSVGDVDGGTF